MTKKKMIFSYIYMIFTLLVIGFLLSTNIKMENLKNLFSDMNYTWFAGAIICIVLHWFMDAVIVYQIVPYIAREKKSFLSCVKYGIVGLYYGALTPFASGGQPLQIVYMKRDGVPVGKATAIVSVKLFVWLSSMCFTFIVYMFLRGAFFYNNYKAIFWVAVLGFLVNLFGVIFILIVLINETGAKKIVQWILVLVGKIKLIKHPEKAYTKVEKTILDFAQASSFVRKHKIKVLVSFILSCIKMSFMFAIPYMIFKSFNLDGYGFIDLSSLNTFMFLTVSFMPTPGTSFAAEGGFRLVYYPIFGDLTAMAIAVWRIITYYLILIVGGLVVVFDQIWNIRNSKTIDIDLK